MASMENPHTKLLVVDDDPALRQLLADYLNRHGYDTLLAPDASDLANRITRYAPDLLVLDRMLPGGDGADACRRLREQGEDPRHPADRARRGGGPDHRPGGRRR